MIERPDAGELMAGPLGQWLTGQQELRERTKAKVARIKRWGLIAGGAIAVLVLIFSRDIELTFWAGAIIFGGGHVWAAAVALPVTNAIKGEINTAVAKALELDFAMTCSAGDEWQQARTFGMLPAYDKESFEDRWSGTIGDLPFQSYEAHCQEWQGSGKNRRLVTVFRGAVVQIAFTRRFHGTTLVEGDGLRKAYWGLGGEKDEIELGGLTLQRCEMVDPAFEDRFTVWGNDAVEARFLVHPEYVERLVAVEQAFAGQKLRALFCGGDLVILVETGNQFESGSLEASDDFRLLNRTIDQFGSLADLAHRLNEAPRGNYVPAASA